MTDQCVTHSCATLRDAVAVAAFKFAAVVGYWAHPCTHEQCHADRPRRHRPSRCTALKDNRLDSQPQGMPCNP